jgi:MFS family permease
VNSLFGGNGLSPAVTRILLHSLLFSIAASIADVLLGFYIVSIGLSTTDVGLLSTTMRIAGMVTAMPLGLLVDRIGAQRALALGATAYGLSWAVLLFMETRPALFAAQFLVGTAMLLASTAVQPLLSQHVTDTQRASLFGFNVFAIVIAGTVGGTLGGALPSWAALLPGITAQSAAAYRIALIGLIVLTAAAVLPIIGRFPRPLHTHSGGNVIADQSPISQWRIIRLGLPSLMIGCGAGAILPFQALFLRDAYAQSDAAVGLILGISALGSGIGALMGAPLTARIGARLSTTVFRLAAAPAMALLLVPNLYAAVASLTLRGALTGASWSQGDALIVGLTPPAQRGRLIAMSMLLWSMGWAVTSALSGWLQPRFGYAPQFVLAALMYVVSAWSGFTLKDDHGRPA